MGFSLFRAPAPGQHLAPTRCPWRQVWTWIWSQTPLVKKLPLKVSVQTNKNLCTVFRGTLFTTEVKGGNNPSDEWINKWTVFSPKGTKHWYQVEKVDEPPNILRKKPDTKTSRQATNWRWVTSRRGNHRGRKQTGDVRVVRDDYTNPCGVATEGGNEFWEPGSPRQSTAEYTECHCTAQV